MKYLLFNILAVGAFYILFSGSGSVSENADNIVRNLTEKVSASASELKASAQSVKGVTKSSSKPEVGLLKKVTAETQTTPPEKQYKNMADGVIREELARRAVEKKAAYLKATQIKSAEKKPAQEVILISEREPKIPVTVKRDQPTAKSIKAADSKSAQSPASDWQKPISLPQFLAKTQTSVQAPVKAQFKSESKLSSPDVALSEGANLMPAKDRRRQLHQLVQQMELVFLDRTGE
jgi:hypothetical protein